MKKILISVIAFSTLSFSQAITAKTEFGKTSPKKLVSSMTLEEKASLLVGTSMESYSGEGAVTGHILKLVAGSAGASCPIDKYNIPVTIMADGPAGLRIDPIRENDDKTYYCTAFPIGTMLASTWNEEVIELTGSRIGNEVLEYGCDVILGPGMNIHRNPLCGRNFEYYSEDPFLSGKSAAAMVRGIQSQGVGTSIKHFAGNNQESLRLQNDARISPRALREIYLKGFEIAVKESDPWTIMSSYNRLNGLYTQENRELLTTILREEWGYKGIVVTDWIGKRNTVAQVNAGNDMMMPGEYAQVEEIVNAVKEGRLKESDVDICAERIIEYIAKTPHGRGYAASNNPDMKFNAEISRKVAQEGMVLLKNDSQALPLKQDAVVALFGINAYDGVSGGIGAGYVNKSYMINLDKGLKNAGITLNKSVDALYNKYMDFGNSLLKEQNSKLYLGQKCFVPETALTPEYIALRADESDIAIVSVGRISGEYNDRQTSDFDLNPTEKLLIENVCNAFKSKGKKVVVVLNVGGVVETASWKERPDAILLAWQAGQEAGNATADVLTGKSSPSGKLPMTFPNHYKDHPSSKNFPFDFVSYPGDWKNDVPERKVRNLGFTFYEEDIWVGYRYFNTFSPKTISYPFGHGLSYTSFNWSKAKIRRSGSEYLVTVNVVNSGNYAGKDVVELFVRAPKGKLDKPVKELRAFAKTKELKPGESQTLTLRFKADDLASFDESLSAFVVDAGHYVAELSQSSEKVVLELPFEAKASVRKVNAVVLPEEPINKLQFSK